MAEINRKGTRGGDRRRKVENEGEKVRKVKKKDQKKKRCPAMAMISRTNRPLPFHST